MRKELPSQATEAIAESDAWKQRFDALPTPVKGYLRGNILLQTIDPTDPSRAKVTAVQLSRLQVIRTNPVLQKEFDRYLDFVKALVPEGLK